MTKVELIILTDYMKEFPDCISLLGKVFNR